MMEFGVVGLGKIGGGLAHLALEKGMRIVGSSRSGAPQELLKAGLVEIKDVGAFHAQLRPPRIALLYIPAGAAVDTILDKLSTVLEAGDIVADGGNSYWGDSIRRHARLRGREIHFVDIGTSGGLPGARHGACFMVGGELEAVSRLEPLLKALATEGGYVHAGPPGAGHYVKLVHNGIEFGMLQAIAEGFDLLTHHHQPLEIGAVLECWRHGSVIRSWLVDLLAEAFAADPALAKPSAYIEDTGEVNWLVADALRMEVPVPVIAQSVMQLFASRDQRRNWARAIVMMRHRFGGHPFGPEESIARERQESRVGDIVRPGESSSSTGSK
jgi:6-phosphogluconate dehydrogenase